MSGQELKRAEAPLAAPETVTATLFGTSCLPADAYWKVPIRAGQRFQIFAFVSGTCDSRGWTWDNWAHRTGPKGSGNFVEGSLGHPNASIGMLIGAISPIDAGSSMSEDEGRRIFTHNTLLVGDHFDSASPLDGFLYLMFNDTWSFGDNKGSIAVNLTLF